MKNEILIIGTVPETSGLGGVTIHVDRLLKTVNKLSNTNDIKLILCDFKKTSYIKQLYQISKVKVIHIHVSHPALRIFYVLSAILFRTKSILTIHGNIGRFSSFKNFLDKLAIKFCDIPILLNKESYTKAKTWNHKSELISAFIPPIDEEILPNEILNYVNKQRAENKKIFVTNASKYVITQDGKDLYGIDFLVNYFKNQKNFTLIISDPSAQNYLKNKSYNNIKFITYQHSFFALMKESDVVIRATATDGDSLTIREALFLGKPVIATNCVSRPNEVILFEYRNNVSFTDAINMTLTKENQPKTNNVNSVEKLKTIYKKINQ